MRTYHIVTPFQRWACFRPFIAMLEDAKRTTPADTQLAWYPILDRFQYAGSPLEERAGSDWIHPMETEAMVPGWFMGHYKTNHFLGTYAEALPPTDRILVLNDDDFYEPGFFQKIEKYTGDVVICSMKRGDLGKQKSEHPTSSLLAGPNSMYCGAVGGEQLIASARVMRNRRYDPDYCADFSMISQLAKAYEIQYAPEAFVWFNYLEPGRWAQSKEHWASL